MSAPETLEGWFALHDLRTLDRTAWNHLASNERDKAVAEVTSLLTSTDAETPEGWTVAYGVIGHKADLLVIHLRPELSQLSELERKFDETVLASSATRPFSYLSVIEVSRHAAPEGTAGNVESSPYIQSRLYPEIPAKSGYVCFYPMSKKRDGEDNWYTLPGAERTELMRAHGRTGRSYAGKVSQIVTGSMGLDDWEWGVTLFADDPIQFKKLVYEMRFDEVSARYAEFGPFYVGRRLDADQLGRWLGE